MSDLFELREKVEDGAQWRGSINVEVDGEVQTLTVRQLRDPEFWEVMSKIDTDELEGLQDDIPDDVSEELRELQEEDNLDAEQEERLEELQERIEDNGVNMFDKISRETFEGIKQCAKYGVEPDEDDVKHVLTTQAGDIQEQYGGTGNDEARQYVNDHVIEPMVEQSTDFTSFAIGIRVLSETLEDEGN
jgi:uncharacterized protein YaaR (DUF327 family)